MQLKALLICKYRDQKYEKNTHYQVLITYLIGGNFVFALMKYTVHL
jgi:hypothetical protein